MSKPSRNERLLNLIAKAREHHALMCERLAETYSETAFNRTYELIDLVYALKKQVDKNCK